MNQLTDFVISCVFGGAAWFMVSCLISSVTGEGIGKIPLGVFILITYYMIRRT